MSSRVNAFYLSPEAWPMQGESVVMFKGPEAKHMLKVLRLGTGDEVELMDGRGRCGRFVIQRAAGSSAELSLSSVVVHPLRRHGLTLAMGWTKSSRRGVFLEKCVELCAHGIIFWQSGRSQGKVPDTEKESWEEKCIQAAKQCRNPFLPELSVCSGGIEELVRIGSAYDRRFVAWIGPDLPLLAPKMLAGVNGLMVVGPEGGMTEAELDVLVKGGFEPVYLGNSVFRWETAAQYCLSLSFQANQESF